MMQFHLAKALAKPLAQHLNGFSTQTDPYLAEFYWKADIAMIASQACIVAQEQNTLYVMVFCGLEKQDFDHFPAFFRERFYKELTAICQQANLYDKQTLAREIADLCDEQHYLMDPEPIDEGKIPNVIDKLNRRVLYDREPLPVSGREAFEYTFPINSRKPKSVDPSQLTPAEAMGDLCLNLIESSMTQRQHEHEKEINKQVEEAVISEKDNIVHVDFAKHKK